MKLWREVVRFFTECLDALGDDEQAALEQHRNEAPFRQQRWLDTLPSSRA